jgi:hypothetical protein
MEKVFCNAVLSREGYQLPDKVTMLQVCEAGVARMRRWCWLAYAKNTGIRSSDCHLFV